MSQENLIEELKIALRNKSGVKNTACDMNLELHENESSNGNLKISKPKMVDFPIKNLIPPKPAYSGHGLNGKGCKSNYRQIFSSEVLEELKLKLKERKGHSDDCKDNDEEISKYTPSKRFIMLRSKLERSLAMRQPCERKQNLNSIDGEASSTRDYLDESFRIYKENLEKVENKKHLSKTDSRCFNIFRHVFRKKLFLKKSRKWPKNSSKNVRLVSYSKGINGNNVRYENTKDMSAENETRMSARLVNDHIKKWKMPREFIDAFDTNEILPSFMTGDLQQLQRINSGNTHDYYNENEIKEKTLFHMANMYDEGITSFCENINSEVNNSNIYEERIESAKEDQFRQYGMDRLLCNDRNRKLVLSQCCLLNQEVIDPSNKLLTDYAGDRVEKPSDILHIDAPYEGHSQQEQHSEEQRAHTDKEIKIPLCIFNEALSRSQECQGIRSSRILDEQSLHKPRLFLENVALPVKRKVSHVNIGLSFPDSVCAKFHSSWRKNWIKSSSWERVRMRKDVKARSQKRLNEVRTSGIYYGNSLPSWNTRGRAWQTQVRGSRSQSTMRPFMHLPGFDHDNNRTALQFARSDEEIVYNPTFYQSKQEKTHEADVGNVKVDIGSEETLKLEARHSVDGPKQNQEQNKRKVSFSDSQNEIMEESKDIWIPADEMSSDTSDLGSWHDHPIEESHGAQAWSSYGQENTDLEEDRILPHQVKFVQSTGKFRRFQMKDIVRSFRCCIRTSNVPMRSQQNSVVMLQKSMFLSIPIIYLCSNLIYMWYNCEPILIYFYYFLDLGNNTISLSLYMYAYFLKNLQNPNFFSVKNSQVTCIIITQYMYVLNNCS